jgi:DNA-binding response OmpR family regulator
MKTIILLASEEMCAILEDTLEKEYRIISCFDSTTGDSMLSCKPDALILDLFLPGSTGLTFLRKNRASLPPIVITLTTFVSNSLLTNLAELGVTSVIRLPCHLPYLEQHITKLLTKNAPPGK